MVTEHAGTCCSGRQYHCPAHVDSENHIVPSTYAMAAKNAGLDIITWTLERSGLLKDHGGWYYQKNANQ